MVLGADLGTMTLTRAGMDEPEWPIARWLKARRTTATALLCWRVAAPANVGQMIIACLGTKRYEWVSGKLH